MLVVIESLPCGRHVKSLVFKMLKYFNEGKRYVGR